MRLTAALAVALMLGATSAVAADFATPGPDATFTIRLTKGQDYALGVLGDGGHVELVNPAGATTIRLPLYQSPDVGQEFRAAFTGTFRLRVTAAEDGARMRLNGDCKASVKTRCTLKPGQRFEGRLFSWFNDRDWSRLSLKKGRSYTFTYEAPYQDGFLFLRDSRGRELAKTDQGNPLTLTYRAPANGTYYLDVFNGDFDSGGPYTVGMR